MIEQDTKREVAQNACNNAAAESTALTVSDKTLAASTHCMSDIIITEVLKIGDCIHCNALEAQWTYCYSLLVARSYLTLFNNTKSLYF